MNATSAASSRLHLVPPVHRPDPAALAASEAATRIARALEIVAWLASAGDVDTSDESRNAALSIPAAWLHDWFTTSLASADLKAGTEGLRLEAQGLFEALRVGRDLRQIATRAKRWATAVECWAQLTRGMAL